MLVQGSGFWVLVAERLQVQLYFVFKRVEKRLPAGRNRAALTNLLTALRFSRHDPSL